MFHQFRGLKAHQQLRNRLCLRLVDSIVTYQSQGRLASFGTAQVMAHPNKDPVQLIGTFIRASRPRVRRGSLPQRPQAQ